MIFPARWFRWFVVLCLLAHTPAWAASEFILKGSNGEDFKIFVNDSAGASDDGVIEFGPKTGDSLFKFYKKRNNNSVVDKPGLAMDALCVADGSSCVAVSALIGLQTTNVTQITAGDGISIDQATGNVTISANYDDSTVGVASGQLTIKDASLAFGKFTDVAILTAAEDDDTTGGGTVDDLIEANGSLLDTAVPTAKAVADFTTNHVSTQIAALRVISDGDGDTKIQVETGSSDDDLVKFYAGGTHMIQIDATSVIMGNMTGDARGTGAIDMQFVRTAADDVASGDYSFIGGGADNTASGNYSFATGKGNTASGLYTHVEGFENTASGSYAHAEGYQTTASGNYSHAEGYQTTASGLNAHAGGYNTTASGSYTHSQGKDTVASGTYSYVGGLGNTAKSYGETVFGLYADTSYTLGTNGATTWNDDDRLFIIGNGTADGARSNALEIQKDGDATVAGTWTWASGTDVCITGGNCLSQAITSNDNLGNHIAEQTLQMGGYEINLAGGYISNDGQAEGIYVDNDGTVRTTGNFIAGGEVTSSSDIRLKTNVQPLEDSLAKINQLQGVTFEWKDPARGSGTKVGLIAQDVETVYPELVSNHGEYKSVNYGGMVSPLIESVKTLSDENRALESYLGELEQEVAALKARANN